MLYDELKTRNFEIAALQGFAGHDRKCRRVEIDRLHFTTNNKLDTGSRALGRMQIRVIQCEAISESKCKLIKGRLFNCSSGSLSFSILDALQTPTL